MTCRALKAQHRIGLLVGMVLALQVTLGSTAQGQVGFLEDRERVGIDLRQSFRSWTIDDEVTGESVEIRQFAARARATVDVVKNVDLTVYTAGGYSQDRRDVINEIAGLTDAKLKAYGYFWDDQLVASMGVNIPTGITALTDEEVTAVQAVSPNILGFTMKNYGGGTDLDLGLAVGRDLGRGWAVGGGASILVQGSYDLDSRSEYDPGAEIAVTAGADWRARGVLVSLDCLYRMFGDDQLDDAGSFADGNQFETTLRGAWQATSWGVAGNLRHVLKQDSEFDWARPASENRVENGHNIWMTLNPYYRLHDAVDLKGILEYATVEQSQQQATGAWALGFGGGLDVRLTPRAIVAVQAVRLTGSNDDGTLDLSGFGGMLTVRWQY